METINIRQARERFRELIDGAEQGASVAITRRGKRVAVLAPPQPEGYRLPDLGEFRASITPLTGLTLSGTVLDLREHERY